MRRQWGMRGMTPLLDLLFLLLFGLLALSDSKRSSDTSTVEVRLPKVEPPRSEPAGKTKRIVLIVDAQSRVRFEDHEDAVQDVAALDRALAARVGDALPEEYAVVIRGDADARHGVMVGLLQHLRARGFAAVHLLALGEEGVDWTREGRR